MQFVVTSVRKVLYCVGIVCDGVKNLLQNFHFCYKISVTKFLLQSFALQNFYYKMFVTKFSLQNFLTKFALQNLRYKICITKFALHNLSYKI